MRQIVRNKLKKMQSMKEKTEEITNFKALFLGKELEKRRKLFQEMFSKDLNLIDKMKKQALFSRVPKELMYSNE